MNRILKFISRFIPIRFNIGETISTGEPLPVELNNPPIPAAQHLYNADDLQFFVLRSNRGIFEIEEALYSRGKPCYRIRSECSDVSFVIPEEIFNLLFEEKHLVRLD